MPVTYRINSSLRMVFSRGEGEVTEAEILDHRRRLREHQDFQPSFSQLVDLREVTKAALSLADMRVIASRTNLFNEESRRALVAQNDAVFGLARMYQMLREEGPEKIMVFREMPEARRWLGLD